MIIFALVGVIFGMTIGYSFLSRFLYVNGTSKITSTWDVHFTNITEGTLVDATTIEKSIAPKTSATFNVDLKKPGSSAEYIITVANEGTINAEVSAISGINEINSVSPIDIVYSISDISVGDKLQSGATKTFKIKVVWNPLATAIIASSKKATIVVDFVQSDI